MNDVIGGPDGRGVAGRVVIRPDGQRQPHGAGARPAPLASRQDALAGHVEPDRRDGYVELVADGLEGLSAGDALCRTTELLVRATDTTVRCT